MQTIRVHAVSGTNDGAESVDFTGGKFIGKEQGDRHRTLVELDQDGVWFISTPSGFPIKGKLEISEHDWDELKQSVLQHGPKINANLLSKMKLNLGPLGDLFLRLGLWDKEVPRHTITSTGKDVE